MNSREIESENRRNSYCTSYREYKEYKKTVHGCFVMLGIG